MIRSLLILVVLVSSSLLTLSQPVIIGDFTEETLNAARMNGSSTIRATTERSDTIDLLHFNIFLSVGKATDPTISGYAIVEFKSKMDNVSQLYLDLLKLNVDSVIQENQSVPFDYSDSTTLIINLINPLQQEDSSAVTVYYHGHPVNDGTFGGMYFSGEYAFNVGMSLSEIPHNVGRMWHPCYDNFVERASYEFHITCDSTRNALCNGSLIDSTNNSDGTVTWHWKLDETIPTFIAGFAVSNFTTVDWTFNGINGPVPVVLGAAAADTVKMKNSFGHLEGCFNTFESHYGPYIWNKVGFNALPFDQGAMEHLGSIVYPQFACNGLFTYEGLMAHELAHHWWGNAVTPYDATEVWLKEGWAVFSEFLFGEFQYGRANYDVQVLNNHEISVHYDHIFDFGYQPLSPMPLYTTFGRTTYTKSADVVHTLRSYMGDSAFFGCLKSFVSTYAFQNYKSSDLRDYLSGCSGMDLTSFFDDWVFAPGFSHFSIDSVITNPDGSGHQTVSVHIRQRLNHAPHFYHDVPLEITFMNENMQQVTEKVMASGPCTIYQTSLLFNPAFVCLDMHDKIADAISDDFAIIKTTGLHVFAHGKMNVTVNAIGGDSALVRIEHSFVAPDPIINPIPDLHLSQERYWRVDGVMPAGFDAKANLYYNGTNIQPPTTYNGGYLDNELITNVEDSLVVMYRPMSRLTGKLKQMCCSTIQACTQMRKGL
jgi:aminopeptidase N